MKILLISDTHGKLSNLRILMSRMHHVDLVLHMGDAEGDEGEIRAMLNCSVEFVKGNCDTFSREEDEKVLEIGAHRILMTHGHRRGVNWDLSGLEVQAKEVKADVVCFGHTHVPEQSEKDGTLFINPGSLSRPRQDGHRPSFAVLEIDGKEKCHVSLNTL